MTLPVAIVVEDDNEQVRRITRILTEAKYTVNVFRSAVEARSLCRSVDRPVDLVVLDRQLPLNATEEPVESVGDELLEDMLSAFADSPFVVFTAYADIANVQQATRNRGQLILESGNIFDRVTHFQKTDFLEFEKYVTRIARGIERLKGVEISGLLDIGGVSDVCRRLLRKVAIEFGGVTIRANPLEGGLTSSLVFDVLVCASSGAQRARIVVKLSDGRKRAATGGLHLLLPSQNVAAPGLSVNGMCDGWRADTFQIAGLEPSSLSSLMKSDDKSAASATGQLIAVVSKSVSPVETTRSLEDVCSPLIAYADLRDLLIAAGLEVPQPSLMMRVRLAEQHGDLHPGNVLVVDGSPTLIDFDSEVPASILLDPLTMLLGMIFHKTSPLRGSGWPAAELANSIGSEAFAASCPLPEWCAVATDWVRATQSGKREFWTLVLAFSARQLRFPDVLDDPVLAAFAHALAATAVTQLST